MNDHVRRGLRTGDYDYELPHDRIAQTPAERRDQSRLMIVHRAAGTITHGVFADIAGLIAPGDALALNTTRVFRARLIGTGFNWAGIAENYSPTSFLINTLLPPASVLP